MPAPEIDYSKMTDAELDSALAVKRGANIASSAPATDYSKMTDAELDSALAAKKSGGIPMAGPQIRQEMPDIEGLGLSRLAVKNLGTDTGQSVQYLQKQHPDAEFSTGPNDQILAKKKGAKDWGVLDPDTGPISMDTFRDVGDIGGDIAGGFAQGAATAAGGLAGGLPGAMAAGSASGAGIEGIRQYLGKLAGVNQEMDLGQVGMSGAIGAVAPMLFGTGATAAQVEKKLAGDGAKNFLLRKGLMTPTEGALTDAERQIAKDVLSNSQRSGVMRVLSGAREASSGITAAESKAFAKKYDLMETLSKEGLDDHFKTVGDDVLKKTYARHKEISAAIGTALDEAQSTVNIEDSIKPLKELLAEKSSSTLGTGPAHEAAQEIANFIEEHTRRDVMRTLEDGTKEVVMVPTFNKAGEKIGQKALRESLGEIPAKDAMELKQLLSDFTANSAKGGYKNLEGKAPASQQLIGAIRRTNENITERIGTAIQEVAPARPDGKKLLEAYKEQKNIERTLLPLLNRQNPAKGMHKILTQYNRDAGKGMSGNLNRIGKAIGFDLADQAENLNLYNKFNNASWAPVSTKGTTSTSKTMATQGLAKSLGHGIMKWFGAPDTAQFIGGEIAGSASQAALSPAARRAWLAGQNKAGKALSQYPQVENISKWLLDNKMLTPAVTAEKLYNTEGRK